jgi:hypothetical protein
MRPARRLLTPVLILMLSSAPLQAASPPVIQAATFGVELCPQSICGAAIFTGVLFGRVGNNPLALGTFIVGINHGPLPEVADEMALITGGAFELRVGLRKLRGTVTGGSITHNGDNTFTDEVNLELADGGELLYRGTLDHNVFPPTIAGPLVLVGP